MSSENNHEFVATYVLFMDIVSYSKLPMDIQPRTLQRLNQIVHDAETFRRAEAAEQVIPLPTGDGMALAFFDHPDSALRCAVEITRALGRPSPIPLRMGVHIGPVFRMDDIKKNPNIAGDGINKAQRVMDCGDAGHILVSETVVEMVGKLSAWAGCLHYLGEAEVKHGESVRVYNVYTDEYGNPEVPKKLRGSAPPTPTPPDKLEGVNPAVSPYVGPTFFTDQNWEFFFGRQKEADALCKLVMRSRVVLVYAPSGAGKSSLLNTLVWKSLDDAGYHMIMDARLGGPPRETVKTVNTDEIQNIYSFYAVYALKKYAPDPGVRLTDYLRSISRKPKTKGRVLVFDQFEELFTQHGDRHEDRARFFDDLVDALRDDPTLRLVFAMRQEHLGDIYPLAERFPDDDELKMKMQFFPLPRMGSAGALEAIIRPAERYAGFAPGVAEKILHQLYLVKVPRSDGETVLKRAEHVEMMHLQIVCHRLWARLPKGITVIGEEHLERAASEGQTFEEFVVNALDAFYDSTVREVSSSDETRVRGGDSEGLIRLGCMKFVSTALTRTMVKRTDERVGRLPIWVVNQLVDRHLLRCEKRGDDEWYELAHDRLVEPIGRQKDRNFSKLLYASDVLDKMLEKAKEEKGAELEGYFEPHRDILKEWQPFRGKVVLFKDEAEFLFRASLAADYQVGEWSRSARAESPEIWLKVLREALRADRIKVRRNAAALVGREQVAELAHELPRLALSDPVPEVQRTATVSLAHMDSPELYDELFRRLDDPATRADAETALSHTRVAADSEVHTPEFEKAFGRLPRGARTRLRRRSWALRFHEWRSVILFIGFLAGVFGAVAATAYKWLPGLFGFALTQTRPSAGMSAFHGLTAGFIWAGFITLGITLHDRVFARRHDPKGYLRPYGAIALGAAGGLLSSLVIVLIIVSVFTTASLAEMGWVAAADKPRQQFGLAMLNDLFVGTRFGYVHLITGVGLGVGMALMTNGLRASKRWSEFVEEHKNKLSSLKQTKKVVIQIVRIAWHRAWPLPLALALAAAAAALVPRVPAVANEYHNRQLHVVLGLAGDCTSQVIGGFFGIVGMGLGIIIVRYGFEFQPRKRRL